MASGSVPEVVTVSPLPGPAARFWKEARRFIARKPLGAAGAAVVVLVGLTALLAPLLSPFNPLEMHFADRLQAPGRPYLLGTDIFGRDVLSNILWGSRISLAVGFLSVLLGTGLGALWGLFSGYAEGGPLLAEAH